MMSLRSFIRLWMRFYKYASPDGLGKIRVPSVFHPWLTNSTALCPGSSTPNCLWPHGWVFAGERAVPAAVSGDAPKTVSQTEWFQ
jgi:hypothetical protein